MKRFEGLEARLELQRLPKGLRTPGDQKRLTAQGVFNALERNKTGVERFTRNMAKLNRKEQIKSKIESGEQIIVENCDELIEFIACVLGKDISNVNLHGYNTREEYENTTLAFIFIFFARSIGFSTEDMKKGRHLPMTTGVMNDPKRHEQTGLHIIQNHPALLVLGVKMGLDFNTENKQTKKTGHFAIGAPEIIPEVGITVTVKKGSSMEETLNNIYQVLGKEEIESTFEECKTQDQIRQWTDDQKAIMGKLCYIMNQIYIKRGDKGKIAATLANKTRMNLNTIKSTYIVSIIHGLNIQIES